jgi:transcriptional regulator with XRE-family HTH domain
MDINANQLGTNIVYLRTQKGLNQKDFAAKIGVSQVSLSNYEHGKQTPPLEMLVKIADALDVSLDDLCGRAVNYLNIGIEELITLTFRLMDIDLCDMKLSFEKSEDCDKDDPLGDVVVLKIPRRPEFPEAEYNEDYVNGVILQYLEDVAAGKRGDKKTAERLKEYYGNLHAFRSLTGRTAQDSDKKDSYIRINFRQSAPMVMDILSKYQSDQKQTHKKKKGD